MKTMLVAASCSCILLSVMLGSCASAEPVAKEGISFSLPFGASLNGGLALADKFKPGLNVVLVGAKICEARTGAKFVHENSGLGAPPVPEPGIPAGERYYRFWATDVLGYGECGPLRMNVAIIGIGAEAVKVISPEKVRSRVPKQIESKARRLLLAREAAKKDHVYGPLSDESPKAFRTKAGMLLDFSWKDEEGNGPSVWVIDNKIFPLPGVCRGEYRFFSIDDRLHLAFRSGGCCRCGDDTLYVYDLSGSKPKKLYENSKLGD